MEEERIHRLETRLLHTEDLIDTLNMTVYRQQEQLLRLQRQLAELAGRVSSMATETPAPGSSDEVPPHY